MITNKGYTLVELLVVLLIFSTLSILATQALTNSLRTSSKSKNVGNIKTNLEYAVSDIERQMRVAESVSCNVAGDTVLQYSNNQQATGYIKCQTSGTRGYITIDYADFNPPSDVKLTSDTVDIDCGSSPLPFKCDPGNPLVGLPPYVDIYLSGNENGVSGAEAAQATVQTKILLRTY